MVDKYKKVLEILNSQMSDLRSLAKLSGRESHHFYNYADLRGLDLRGHDLIGLNFDWADLRGADLREISISSGALNNAKVDKRFEDLKDEFDCYIADILTHQITKLAIFARFRFGLFEMIAERFARPLKDLAKYLGVGTSTLRRMRNSEPVSMETLKTIYPAISGTRLPNAFPRDADPFEEIKFQPCIQFGEFDDAVFTPVDRLALLECIPLVDEINAVVNAKWTDGKGYFGWSIKPSKLVTFLRFYSSIEHQSPSSFFEPRRVKQDPIEELPLFKGA